MDYGNTKKNQHAVNNYLDLGNATLLQLDFLGESYPNFPLGQQSLQNTKYIVDLQPYKVIESRLPRVAQKIEPLQSVVVWVGIKWRTHSDCPSLLCLWLVSAPATSYPFCGSGSHIYVCYDSKGLIASSSSPAAAAAAAATLITTATNNTTNK